MSLAFGFALPHWQALSAGFNPISMFAGGVNGVLFDISDLPTLFTTSSGTTPVSMPGQGSAVSVGLMLDKSQGLVLGPELVTATPVNGTLYAFSTFTTSGVLITSAIKTPTDFAGASWDLGSDLPVGTIYEATITIAINSGPAPKLIVGTTNNGSPTLRSNIASLVNGQNTVKLIITGASARYLTVGTESAAYNFSVTSISLKRILGNHAIAINDSTARPELRARVNLLVATATLSTQSVTTQATSYTLRFAGTGSITLSGTATGLYSAGTHTITCTAGTLTLTVSGTVTTADLRPANSGALLPAYQAVVDANTYDTAGFPLYLRFDGIDDGMYTPANLNLSATDKVGVFAGVRKLSDAATAIFTELSAVVGATNPGSFAILAPSGAAANNFRFTSSGTAPASASATSFVSPVSAVLTGIGDIAGDVSQIRANGSVAGTNTGDQGTGNYGTYPLYIGSRANSSLWFQGQVYGLVIVGSAVSAGNISATESWMAGKTGLVLP